MYNRPRFQIDHDVAAQDNCAAAMKFVLFQQLKPMRATVAWNSLVSMKLTSLTGIAHAADDDNASKAWRPFLCSVEPSVVPVKDYQVHTFTYNTIHLPPLQHPLEMPPAAHSQQTTTSLATLRVTRLAYTTPNAGSIHVPSRCLQRAVVVPNAAAQHPRRLRPPVFVPGRCMPRKRLNS
jgi:hypothetical protein